jgi:hypothetical protein
MSDDEQLSDEQRIGLLEDKVGKNRTVITIVALTLIVILSVSITVLILKILHVDEPYASRSNFEQQALLILQLQTEVIEQKKSISELTLIYDNSQVAAFQQNLIEQEQGYQSFLAALKLGMVDLAKMVQGSRTWLDVYNEKLDEVKNLSSQREKKLQRLSTTKVSID